MTRRLMIILVLVFALVAFAGGTWLANKSAAPADVPTVASALADRLVRPHSPILGAPNAPVTIVEFFDPACEACRAFHPVVKQTLAEHGDSVRVVIRYAPFHGDASETAVRILEAARRQARFEPVLEALLAAQPVWAQHGNPQLDVAWQAAGDAGLDVEEARRVIADPEIDAVLAQDAADVAAVGVQRTPTFFVDGRPLMRFGADELKAMVRQQVEATS